LLRVLFDLAFFSLINNDSGDTGLLSMMMMWWCKLSLMTTVMMTEISGIFVKCMG